MKQTISYFRFIFQLSENLKTKYSYFTMNSLSFSRFYSMYDTLTRFNYV